MGTKHITTTLKAIRAHHPCAPGWAILLASLDKAQADDEPLPLEYILYSNGIDDALWALRCVEGYDNAFRLFACYCAKRVLPVFEEECPNDLRPRNSILTAESYARGYASDGELAAAEAAVRSAVEGAVRSAAWAAARSAAWAAARSAAEAAAWAAAWAAARSAAEADFALEFSRMCRLEGEYGEVVRSDV